MVLGDTKGIILFTKQFKEKDKLVKIFTESHGKLMFLVKGAYRKNNPLIPAILPFTKAVYIGDFRHDGLSFLNNSKEVTSFRNIQQDIFINAYATYILNLVDAAIEDRVYDPLLYQFTNQALTALEEGKDAEIITNIFEVQLLHRFGVILEWHACAVCGNTNGKFDFSPKYSGVLCEKHWILDSHRYHSDPRCIHFIRLFSAISYDQVQTIHVKETTKLAIRKTIDELYDDYVGIHLKSKTFIDKMHTWEHTLKIPSREPEALEKE